MRSNNQDGGLGTRKDISNDLGGEEAKADPNNESGYKVVEILKNSAESRSRYIFIHSKEAKSGRKPNEEERRDEDDDSEGEESEAANEKTDLVTKTKNNLLLPNRDWTI